MNKQEQIEEMEKIIDELYNVYDTPPGDIAKGIYNAGYRKIPENVVVLTKEEYIDLSRNYVTEQIEKARKETAKEIINEIVYCARINTKAVDGVINKNSFVECVEVLAKKYGVEVEE